MSSNEISLLNVAGEVVEYRCTGVFPRGSFKLEFSKSNLEKFDGILEFL